MHNPESVLQNETHKLSWDFEIQTDHLISDRRPGLIIINKKERTYKIVQRTVWHPCQTVNALSQT